MVIGWRLRGAHKPKMLIAVMLGGGMIAMKTWAPWLLQMPAPDWASFCGEVDWCEGSLSKQRTKDFHSVTDIVSATYCEQKVVFDRELGDARPREVRAKAAAGTASHMRFETVGKARASIDRRCFIATAVYGPDAPETDFLRGWRDRVLVPTLAGRFVVRTYYALSPLLVSHVMHRPWAAAMARGVLNRALVVLGMRK